ncbi:MAG: hypothetical protein AAB400_01195 [Patescibacteria group bacterium]
MPKPSIELKEPAELLTIEETCRPELDRMGVAEVKTLRSLKDPIQRIAKGIEQDHESVEDALDRAAGAKGGPKRRAARMERAIQEIANIYNSDESLRLFSDTIREVEAKLRQVAQLRMERMQKLQQWISELSGKQEKLGVQLGTTRQEARRGDVAATFELKAIEQELAGLGESVLNQIYPELQAERSSEVISQEELKTLETRVEGILARIHSLLAPPVAPKRVTGPLGKKQERWAEGAYRQ